MMKMSRAVIRGKQPAGTRIGSLLWWPRIQLHWKDIVKGKPHAAALPREARLTLGRRRGSACSHRGGRHLRVEWRGQYADGCDSSLFQPSRTQSASKPGWACAASSPGSSNLCDLPISVLLLSGARLVAPAYMSGVDGMEQDRLESHFGGRKARRRWLGWGPTARSYSVF
ncbi:hypothetical protein VTK73DRAFT_8907 [Phialemonium thermophilum]|uniref:Uncharacterized protein n=1 Tax=Phialemonium thermophilum TaxID=223376 RepID=A0ABR3W5T6_9PEZI